MWMSIPELQIQLKVSEIRGYGQKTRELLVAGYFGDNWRTVVGKRHTYEVGPEAQKQIEAYWQQQGWIGTADGSILSLQDASMITAEAYKQALRQLEQEGRLLDIQLKWLRAHYNAPQHVITAGELADLMGYQYHGSVNLWYGDLGKKVAELVGYQPPEGYTQLSTLVTFDREESPYPMRLRPNFVQALESLGWVQVNGPAVTTRQIPDINYYYLNQYYRAFVEFVERKAKGEKFTSFDHPYLNGNENYKPGLQIEARQYLNDSSWREREIGKGDILQNVIDAIEKPKDNNLVQSRKYLRNPASRIHRSLYEAQNDPAQLSQYERLFYDFFHHRIDDEEAMAKFIGLAGQKYGLIAYFYFLKNPRKYLPIAPANFDKAFQKLGIDFKTNGQCSWDNYQNYNHLVGQVQSFLRQQFSDEDVSLLDAHSFLWIVKYNEVQIQPALPDKTLSAQPCHTRARPTPPGPNRAAGPVDFDTLQLARSRIGREGEDYVVEYERNTLIQADRHDLAAKVERITDHTLGFDVRSYELDETEKQIEVKSFGSKGNSKTFFLTQNELEKSSPNITCRTFRAAVSRRNWPRPASELR